MNYIDELNYKNYNDVDEELKEMDFDELSEELEEKLDEYSSFSAYEDKWLMENDEDALDADYCENACYLGELDDEISDILVVMKEKYSDKFENSFPEISRMIDESY